MARPIVLNHKKGCLWYEMKIEKIDRQISSLNEKKRMIEDMMNVHYQKQLESQKRINERNRVIKKRLDDKKGT